MKKTISVVVLFAFCAPAFSGEKAMGELKAEAPAAAVEAILVPEPFPAADLKSQELSVYESEIIVEQSDAKSAMQAMAATLKGAGATVLSGKVQKNGAWYSYQITFLGPKLSVYTSEIITSQEEAAAAMKKMAATLQGAGATVLSSRLGRNNAWYDFSIFLVGPAVSIYDGGIQTTVEDAKAEMARVTALIKGSGATILRSRVMKSGAWYTFEVVFINK
jgi:hypothetical protein